MNSEERIRAVAVYCGSSIGKRAAYAKAAHSVGIALAKSNRPLIYGGGTLGHGLMGTVAHAVVEAGGKVTGVTPYALVAAGGEEDKSIEPNGIKRRAVALPASSSNNPFLEASFFEVTTWTQIGIHDKPRARAAGALAPDLGSVGLLKIDLSEILDNFYFHAVFATLYFVLPEVLGSQCIIVS
ncbi:hypothetical protein EV368DRAFT_60917 [Lentinula lateritia]|nr:hypothetical protein EV368DRAFT_60917 [Lentinula lateritia]